MVNLILVLSLQVPFVLPTVPEVSLCLSFEGSPQTRPTGNQRTGNAHGKSRRSSEQSRDSPQSLVGKENNDPLERYSYSESPFAHGRTNAKQTIMLSGPQLADSREPLKPLINPDNKQNTSKPGRNSSVKLRQELISPQGNKRPAEGRQKPIHESQRLVTANRQMSDHQHKQVNQRQRAVNRNALNKEYSEDSHKQDSRERMSRHEEVSTGQRRGVVFVVDEGNESHPRKDPGLKPISPKGEHKIQEQRGGRRSIGRCGRDHSTTERSRHMQEHVHPTRGQGNGNARRLSNQNGRVSQQSGWVFQESQSQNDSGFTSADHIVTSPPQGSPHGPLASNGASKKRQDVNGAIPSQVNTGFHGNSVQQQRNVCIVSRRRSMEVTENIEGKEQKELFLEGSTDPRVSFSKTDSLQGHCGSLPASETQQQHDKKNQEVNVEESEGRLTLHNQTAFSNDSSRLDVEKQHANSSNSLKGIPEEKQNSSGLLPAGVSPRPDPYELLMRQEMQLKQLQEQVSERAIPLQFSITVCIITSLPRKFDKLY